MGAVAVQFYIETRNSLGSYNSILGAFFSRSKQHITLGNLFSPAQAQFFPIFLNPRTTPVFPQRHWHILRPPYTQNRG